MGKCLLSLKKPMMKIGQIGRCKGLEKLGRHVVAAHNRLQIFLFINCVSKSDSFVSEWDLVI